MSKLKKAEIVDTKEGTEGGYHYVDNPCELPLSKVAAALDFEFVSNSWKSGKDSNKCLIGSEMAGVMNNLYGELNKACYEKLNDITICRIEKYIFKENTVCKKENN